MPTIDDVHAALRLVMDPEIPTISLVDLGVITEATMDDAGNVRVVMTPTFMGCPAMDYMKNNVINRLESLGCASVEVRVTLDVPWNTNRLTDEGRAALLRHGLAPPDSYDGVLALNVLNNVACPLCGGRDTFLSSPFGPTLCRSLHYCNHCRQAFEAFKPV